MILVLADDFSGAAEMAGMAHFLGCSAEVQTAPHQSSSSQVVAIDTHTRGLSRQEAALKLEGMIPAIQRMQASWVFKKVDSVLRGHVLRETETIMHGLGLGSGVIISANPSKKRVIRGGEYFIEETPLHQTLFARDPVFPAKTSDVMKLLGASDALNILSSQDPKDLDAMKGLLVPDVSSKEDVRQWARHLPVQTLAVGGVDFFNALLRHRNRGDMVNRHTRTIKPPLTQLLVCGSFAAMESGRRSQCQEKGWPVHVIPFEWLMSNDSILPEVWCENVKRDMQLSGRCMVGVATDLKEPVKDPSRPAQRLVEAVVQLCQACPVDQILVEGGETAYLLMQFFNRDRFHVTHSSREGIPAFVPVGMESLSIVPKPGSYSWPNEFLDA